MTDTIPFSGIIVWLYDRFSDDLGVNERLLFERTRKHLVYSVTRIGTKIVDFRL